MKQIEEFQKINLDDGELQRHECLECTNMWCRLEKYEKLIELLYRKIRRLQSKNSGIDSNKQGSITDRMQQKHQRFTLCKQLQVQIEATKRIEREKESTLQKPSNKIDNIGERIEEMKKTNLFQKMSEKIMQLQTNLMHIRSCVYFVFRQVNLWKITEKNELSKKTMQYSQDERDEMCGMKRVKFRKIEKKMNTEQSVYITVKQR